MEPSQLLKEEQALSQSHVAPSQAQPGVDRTALPEMDEQ
jgi:hypothetical protein